MQELRYRTADLVTAVEAGEVISLTVNSRPVADIVPHSSGRSPWVPSSALRQIVEEAGSDGRLLADLVNIRETELDGG